MSAANAVSRIANNAGKRCISAKGIAKDVLKYGGV
jgi:hypothetical protein